MTTSELSSYFQDLHTVPSSWAEEAEAHVQSWVRDHRLVRSARAGERFDKTRAGDLSARVYSTATSAESLVTAATWIGWLFLIDDQLDEGDAGKDPSAARRRLSPLSPLLTSPSTRHLSPPGPLETSLADVWQHVGPTMPPSWRRRFVRHVVDYFNGCVWEATNRAKARVPRMEEFLPYRRSAGAIWPSLDLLEFVTRTPVPGPVQEESLFIELRTAAADVVCWTDDLMTLDKERARGDVHNLVIVLEEAIRCPTATARRMVEDRVKLRIADFNERARQMPHRLAEMNADAPTCQAALLHVDGLGDWMRGHFDWGLRTDRYLAVDNTPAGAAPAYLEEL